MRTSTIVVIAFGILSILAIFLSKEKEMHQAKISKILGAVLVLIYGMTLGVLDIHPAWISIETIRYLRFISNILLGVILGIALTLRIFGHLNFTKKRGQ